MPTVDIGAIEASASEIPVIADGFKGVQIAPGSTSPMADTGHAPAGVLKLVAV